MLDPSMTQQVRKHVHVLTQMFIPWQCPDVDMRNAGVKRTLIFNMSVKTLCVRILHTHSTVPVIITQQIVRPASRAQ